MIFFIKISNYFDVIHFIDLILKNLQRNILLNYLYSLSYYLFYHHCIFINNVFHILQDMYQIYFSILPFDLLFLYKNLAVSIRHNF